MTAAERATLSYSRSQMLAALLFGLLLLVVAYTFVRVGFGYGVLVLLPFFGATIAMYLIGYTMHTAAAETVTARHMADKLAIDTASGAVQRQTYEQRSKLERDVLRWWSAGNPTTFRATQAQFGIAQSTWESLRNRAVLDGLAGWEATPTGNQLVWQASQAATVAATA